MLDFDWCVTVPWMVMYWLFPVCKRTFIDVVNYLSFGSYVLDLYWSLVGSLMVQYWTLTCALLFLEWWCTGLFSVCKQTFIEVVNYLSFGSYILDFYWSLMFQYWTSTGALLYLEWWCTGLFSVCKRTFIDVVNYFPLKWLCSFSWCITEFISIALLILGWCTDSLFL